MAKNYTRIRQRVDAAIKRAADTSQPGGYPATIRRITKSGGSDYDPASGTRSISYSTVYVVETANKERDRDGTLTGTVRRTLLVGADTGFVPSKADKVLVGQSLTYVDAATDAGIDWEEIDDVCPLSPAGVDVMYEIMLAN